MEQRKEKIGVLLRQGKEGREKWKKRGTKVKGLKLADTKVVFRSVPENCRIHYDYED